MEISSYRDAEKCKTILKIVVDDDLEDIEEAKRLIAEDTREQLRKYWKIEQELGIPLEVLFKALKDGIWYRNDYYKSSQIDFNFNFKHLIVKYWFKGWEDGDCLEIKDYGKTWWLEKPKEKVSD